MVFLSLLILVVLLILPGLLLLTGSFSAGSIDPAQPGSTVDIAADGTGNAPVDVSQSGFDSGKDPLASALPANGSADASDVTVGAGSDSSQPLSPIAADAGPAPAPTAEPKSASEPPDGVPSTAAARPFALTDPADQNPVQSASPKNAVNVAGPESPLNVSPDVGSVVFVIDKSGSMSGQRLARTKAALIQSIHRLHPEQSFCVFLFDEMSVPLNPLNGKARLKPATKNNIQKVAELIEEVSASGGTEPHAALEAAIRLRPELIILLSDGDFDPGIVVRISELNGQQRPMGRIDCIGLDENILTLRELARQNHGIYHQAASR